MAKNTSSTNKNTNLFYSLYSTSNDLATSGFVCNSAVDEADTSFDISDSAGEITDSNGDTVASIDMSEIHSDEITEYYTETKILSPYSAYLLQGNVTGDTYSALFFRMYDDIASVDGYESFINLNFIIHYTNCDEIKVMQIDTYQLRTEAGDVCTIIQNELDDNAIPVTVTIKNLNICDCNHDSCKKETADYLVFQSSSEGYSFYVHSVYVTAIESDYNNYNNSYSDYSESPFINANIDFDYVINLIKTEKPLLIGNEEYDYTKIPCDIYRYFINIAPMVIYDHDTFADNVKKLERFLECFEPDGTLIQDKEQDFILLSHMYPDIYTYYWGNEYSILNKYNINSIIAMLNTIAFYAYDSNVHGPYSMEEEISKRIYNQKYLNGALRGMVLIPDWSSASDDYSVLKINHVSDFINVEEEVQLPEGFKIDGCCDDILYRKVKSFVKINTLLQSEYEIYRTCDCFTPVKKVVSNESMNNCIDSVWTSEVKNVKHTEYNIWSNEHNFFDSDVIDYNIYEDDERHNKHRRHERDYVIDSSTIDSSMIDTSTRRRHHQDVIDSSIQNDAIWSDESYPTIDTSTRHHHHHEHHHINVDHDSKYFTDYIDEIKERYEFLDNVPGKTEDTEEQSKNNTVGLYRYMQYLNDNELWQKVGDGYMIIGAKDDYQSKIKNLLNSVLIYNPNNFPVRVKFMVFS